MLPIELLVTLKTTVQLELAGIVMPVKLSEVAPGPRLEGVVPTQVPVTGPPAALMFVRVSLKEALLRSDVLLFDKVRVTAEVPPGEMDVGLKALPIEGGSVSGGGAEPGADAGQNPASLSVTSAPVAAL